MSTQWRRDFTLTYLERDPALFGASLPAEMLTRLWTMIAHTQSGLHNASVLFRSLGLDVRTINRYVDLMVDLFLLRRLQPWYANVGKRLVRSPRLYVRDSGILHTLLQIENSDSLSGNPVAGASWEGFVIEQIVSALPSSAVAGYYRTAAGAEVDLVVESHGGERWGIEIKLSSVPKPSRGFHIACNDIEASRRFVVSAENERYPITPEVEAISLAGILDEIESR